MNKIQESSEVQPPGFTTHGWHCWTGPSGTRYAAPGDKPTVYKTVSAFSIHDDVPHDAIAWLVSGMRR